MIKSISEIIPTTSIRRPPIPPTGREYNCGTSHQCDSCVKLDVCSIKDEFMRAIKDIDEISSRINVFINTDVKCDKYTRGYTYSGVR